MDIITSAYFSDNTCYFTTNRYKFYEVRRANMPFDSQYLIQHGRVEDDVLYINDKTFYNWPIMIGSIADNNFTQINSEYIIHRGALCKIPIKRVDYVMRDEYVMIADYIFMEMTVIEEDYEDQYDRDNFIIELCYPLRNGVVVTEYTIKPYIYDVYKITFEDRIVTKCIDKTNFTFDDGSFAFISMLDNEIAWDHVGKREYKCERFTYVNKNGTTDAVWNWHVGTNMICKFDESLGEPGIAAYSRDYSFALYFNKDTQLYDEHKLVTYKSGAVTKAAATNCEF
jgi:hypothetical protein